MLPTITSFALLGLLSTPALAHMKMGTPVPYGEASLDNSPLSASGTDFPCKQRSGVYDVTQQNKFTPGQDNTLSFVGSAVHGGGTCQLSISSDKEPTKSSAFKVIWTAIGGCPGTDSGPSNFTFKMPDVPNGDYALAWTWFNRVGNREMYMNCAPATVSGSKGSIKLDSLPDMVQANIGNGCSDTEGSDPSPKSPGTQVVKGDAAKPAPFVGTGANCAGGSGDSSSSGSSSGSAPASSGAASSGSDGSTGSGADNSGQCTGSCLGGGAGASSGGAGASSGGAGVSSGGASSAAGGASSAASSPASTSAASDSMGMGGGSASTSAAASAPSDGSAGASGSASGGVFAPGASSAASTTAAPAAGSSPTSTSTLTTMQTVTGSPDTGSSSSASGNLSSSAVAPAGTGAGSAPSSVPSASPASPDAGSGSGSTASSAAPASPAGTGSSAGGSSGQTCSSDGAVVCSSDGKSFGLCDQGAATMMPVATGTTCSNGQITKRDGTVLGRGIDYHVHGGPHGRFHRRSPFNAYFF